MKDRHRVWCILALVSWIGLFLCPVAYAEAPSNLEKIQNIKRLIQLQGGLGDLKQQIDGHITAFCEKVPGLPPKFAESMKKGMDQKDLESLVDKLVSAYDKHFTNEEITGLLKFYESPVGKKVVEVMPQITEEQSAIATEWAQSCAVRVTDKLSGLTRAAAIGDSAKAKEVLAGGVEVDQRDSQGVTPLMVAAYNGNADLAKFLVDKGADVNAKTKRGSTPLMAAVQSGNKEMVKFLLEKGADANAKEQLGMNAYQLALVGKKHELAAMLKDKTTDTKPARPGTVVASLGKAKDCLPVMSQASDSSKKITCLKLGQEVILIVGVPNNNGWTLIQYPKLGWVPPETLKQKLVIGEPQRRMAKKQQESVDSEAPAETPQPSTEAAPKETQDTETVTAQSDQPTIWWRHH